MKEATWSTAARYQPYSSWAPDYIMKLKAQVAASKWRTKTHVQPDTGLINDPCSLNFFNNKWHLYYQQFPFGPVHGLKSWAHAVSKDLFNWRRVPGDLLPKTASGSKKSFDPRANLENDFGCETYFSPCS